MQPCTCTAPAWTAARELATATPASSWQWMPTSAPNRPTTVPTTSARAWGSVPQPDREHLLEELGVLGVGAGPAALDVRHPQLVQPGRDLELVRDREGDPRPLGSVAQGGVIELKGHLAASAATGKRVSTSITA